MPRRFISRTTSSPNGERPLRLRRRRCASRPRQRSLVRERHVPRAEVVQLRERRRASSRSSGRPRRRSARRSCRCGDALDVVGRPRQLERVGVAADHLVDRVDLLERRRARPFALQFGRRPRPTRTGRRRALRGAAGCRSAAFGCGWAMSIFVEVGRPCSRISHGRSLWPSMTGAFFRTASSRAGIGAAGDAAGCAATWPRAPAVRRAAHASRIGSRRALSAFGVQRLGVRMGLLHMRMSASWRRSSARKSGCAMRDQRLGALAQVEPVQVDRRRTR